MLKKQINNSFLILTLSYLLFLLAKYEFISNIINFDSIDQYNFYILNQINQDVSIDENNYLYNIIFKNIDIFVFCFHLINILIVIHLCRNNVHLFLLFPFLLTNIFLPSKEFLSIYGLIFLYYSALQKNLFFILGSFVIIYFIRDAFLFIYLFILSSYYLYNYLKVSNSVAFLTNFLVSFFSFYFINEHHALFGFEFIERNYDYKNLILTHGASNFDHYLINFFGNLTNLVFRNNIVTSEGKLSFFHFSLFFTGIGFLYILYKIFYKRFSYLNDFRSYIFLTSLILISINPIIQPRYLLSSAVLFFYNNKIRLKKDYLFFTIFVIFLSIPSFIIYSEIFNNFPEAKNTIPIILEELIKK
jgi:hypothetical protein